MEELQYYSKGKRRGKACGLSCLAPLVVGQRVSACKVLAVLSLTVTQQAEIQPVQFPPIRASLAW